MNTDEDGKKILLMGHYGGKNTGDDAMLLGILNLLKDNQKVKVTVLAKQKYDMHIDGIDVNFRETNIKNLFSEIIDNKYIILGGGTHFHDDYSRRRHLKHITTMAKLTLIFVFARMIGRRTGWISVGLGPVRHFSTRILIQIGIMSCHVISFRDNHSLEIYNNLRLNLYKPRVFRVHDIAALSIPDILTFDETERKIVGLSAIDLKGMRVFQNDPEMNEMFWRKIAEEIIEAMIIDPRIHINVFEIRGGNSEGDAKISNFIYYFIDNRFPGRIELIPYNLDPRKTIAKINRCDVFIATRYHAALLASDLNIPTMVIVYHSKLKDLAEDIDISAIVEPQEFKSTSVKNFILKNKREMAKTNIQKAKYGALRNGDAISLLLGKNP